MTPMKPLQKLPKQFNTSEKLSCKAPKEPPKSIFSSGKIKSKIVIPEKPKCCNELFMEGLQGGAMVFYFAKS